VIFSAIETAGTGLVAYRKWLDAVSDNIANADDVTSTSSAAYQARSVLVQAAPGDAGVQVVGASFGNAAGQEVYRPDDPHADKQGMVRVPDMDMGDQMSQLIEAQRGYQANIAVVERAKDLYAAALQIGR
jgi:flagellar basal-body rod protein FlgC